MYDIIIFGASGFTGNFILDEVARVAKDIEGFTFAIAGRNQSKLEEALLRSSTLTGNNLQDTAVIIANVNDEDSVKSMVSKTKLVINCVGPYRFYGESVVSACINSGTHHIDISGEPQYLELMQLRYHQMAMDKGVYIIGSCGFDSVPADIGLIYLQNNFGGDVNSVEMVVGLHDSSRGSASINFTTLECAVHGYTHRDELKDIRKQLHPKPAPKSSFKAPVRGNLFWHDTAHRWCLPNLASDRSVIMRTQQLNYDLHKKRPVQFAAFFGMQSVLTALQGILFGFIFSFMTSFAFTRALLLRYPEIFTFGAFTKKGPAMEDLKGLRFCMTLTGHGWDSTLASPEEQHSDPPNIVKSAQLVGPDPGYVSTASIVVQCALTVLQERDKLPQGGGVFTPGCAFLNTTLIGRLQNVGIKFEMI